MFKNIAHFFIKSTKLTFVLVFVSLIVWIWSYFAISKQYNPSIVVPAFSVEVPAYGLSSEEVSKQIVSPIENLAMELEWIDEVYGYVYDNFAGLMIKFNVWVNSEYAKIRLIQKINENLKNKAGEIWNPKITSIDPEELSQITYAINYIWDNKTLSTEEIQIYLRQIANLVKEEVKTVPNVTSMEIVWGLKKNIIIDLDLDKIKARNTDLLEVYQTLKKYNLNMPSWDINLKNTKVFVEVEAKVQDLSDLKKIVITNRWWNPLYLEDIADIRYGTTNIKSFSKYTNNKIKSESVLLGFGKKKWTNAVSMTEAVDKKVKEISLKLPKDIKIEVIQNEWTTAKKATNMLLINLFQSVIIVFLVLAFYLWVKDALNTAISIPLTLSLVFLISLIIWDNINRITLFALILVLWMIVDNSTVVVENISRHLSERVKTSETKLNAVLNWVSEVWSWIIMATITRLLAFGSMFAVTWMMWEYMWPIPKYAIFSLLLSLLVALTINPWFSYMFAKNVTEKDKTKKEKKSKFDVRKIYLNFMQRFIWDEKGKKTKRKLFKIFFWLALFWIILAPIYLGIFKARMLPKSNQNQIYIWVDAPRDTTASKMLEIESYMTSYFFNNNKLEKNLQIIDNVSTTIWNAFIWDFANLFRWGMQRVWENQISSRINLIPKDKLDGRITSENFTIKFRKDFEKYMFKKYPDLKISLQEDPPGPPVMSTFRINLKSEADKKSLDKFMEKVYFEVEKQKEKYNLVDLWNSNSSTYKKINLEIDNASASKAGISTEQITATLWIIFSNTDIWLVKNLNSFEANSLILSVKNDQKNSINALKNISFTNQEWKKIPLEAIAKINYSFVSPEITTDNREEMKTIYAEIWDNSLVYPVIKLFWVFLSDDFLWDEYKIESWNPYGITYKWLKDGKIYKLEWSGEWKLTIDTFRDLWIAMVLSLLVIYFLLVGQFASFSIAWVIMITFLLSFFWVFPGFSVLYLFKNEYFSATSMIWIIALWWIVVWNAIILIDYLNVLKKNWLTIKDALLKAWYVRFAPIILTSLTTVFWAATIIWDPVWSGLAWTIIWGLFVSSFLTLIVIPIFYYDWQKKDWERCAGKEKC